MNEVVVKGELGIGVQKWQQMLKKANMLSNFGGCVSDVRFPLKLGVKVEAQELVGRNRSDRYVMESDARRVRA